MTSSMRSATVRSTMYWTRLFIVDGTWTTSKHCSDQKHVVCSTNVTFSYVFSWYALTGYSYHWRHESRCRIGTSWRHRRHVLWPCDVSANAFQITSCRKNHTRTFRFFAFHRALCRSERWSLIGRRTTGDITDTGYPEDRTENDTTMLVLHP